MDILYQMKKLNLGSDDDSSQKKEARKVSIERCIESLVHACQCMSTNCPQLLSCQKMKRVVTHTKVCKRKTNGGCPICKQLVALCCYHAKHCQEAKCLVPFCSNIKHKLKQQQLQQRLQLVPLLRNNGFMIPCGTAKVIAAHNAQQSSNSSMAVMLRPRQIGPEEVIQIPQQSSESSMNVEIPMEPEISSASLPSPQQSGVVLKRNPDAPFAHIIHIVKQVQEEMARKEPLHEFREVIQGERIDLAVKAPEEASKPSLELQRFQPITRSRFCAHGPTPLRKKFLYLNRRGRLYNLRMAADKYQIPSLPERSKVGSRGIPTMHYRAYRQLMDILKNPDISEQQDSLLQILKGNPALMADLVQKREDKLAPQQESACSLDVVDSAETSTSQNRACRQLIDTLKTPNSPEKRNKIIEILKSNPALLASYVKQRQEDYSNSELPEIQNNE